MPYRCFACNKLSRTEDISTCEDKTKCDVDYVEVVHFVHPAGPGRVMSTKIRIGLGGENTQEFDTELRLCCYSEASMPNHTPLAPAVTCMNCLEFIAKLNEE
jgi:hypothetical protein